MRNAACQTLGNEDETNVCLHLISQFSNKSRVRDNVAEYHTGVFTEQTEAEDGTDESLSESGDTCNLFCVLKTWTVKQQRLGLQGINTQSF